MSKYLSHISADGREQTNLEHLTQTAELCGEFASHFHARELGILTGMAHDIGKFSAEFQNRLKNNGKKVDHSTAGAVECCKLGHAYAAYAVLAHHSGLPDYGSRDALTGSTASARLNRAMKGELCDYSAWKNEFSLPAAALPGYVMRDRLTDIFFIRMLYSCLVDADFLDTAEFMCGEPYINSSYADMEELNRRLDAYISGWFPPKNELNVRRCEILTSCVERASTESSDLLTLTVPTGGGKTIASLAFALRRAIRPDQPRRRIIYIIPYTSIIEQTAEIFRKILGEENVLEHHSGIIYDTNKELNINNDTNEELNKNNIHLARATENWDAPVVVTTAVQFFESFYASRNSRCRKLHNIADSVIVFDEAQMLPLPYLRPCIHVISQLVAHYGVTAVLCTATQPVLEPFFKDYLPDVVPVELCPPELQKDEIFKRVSFRQTERMSPAALAEKLNSHTQVLCIVNSRAAAYELYPLLEKDGSSFHLSTLMTPADRKKILADIRKRLKENLPCRVVSTSLIEAGVDVDFPVVYREEAGLDSILQAAGRCNREGNRRREDSIVTIFKSEKNPPLLFRQAIDAARVVLRTQKDIASQTAVRQYFEEYYQSKGDPATDRHTILGQLDSALMPIRTVAEQFHLIESDTKTVCIPIGEGEQLVEQYRYGEVTRNLIRQLGQYSVAIYEDHFKALYSAGDIEMIGNDFFVLKNIDLYSSETGLSLTADTGKAEFI